MGKHTPGPWTRQDFGNGTHTVHNGDEEVCTLHEMGGSPVDANARLIAAAPELLARFEEIESDAAVPAEPGYHDTDAEALNEARSLLADCREIARAAIAKAKGDQ